MVVVSDTGGDNSVSLDVILSGISVRISFVVSYFLRVKISYPPDKKAV